MILSFHWYSAFLTFQWRCRRKKTFSFDRRADSSTGFSLTWCIDRYINSSVIWLVFMPKCCRCRGSLLVLRSAPKSPSVFVSRLDIIYAFWGKGSVLVDAHFPSCGMLIMVLSYCSKATWCFSESSRTYNTCLSPNILLPKSLCRDGFHASGFVREVGGLPLFSE